MKVLNQNFNINDFFTSLKSASQRTLLLDYDGTLAPFRKERDKAFPYDNIPEILDEIMDSHKTQLVIISGRSIKDLIPLLKLKHTPEIWGAHGWEHLDKNGKYTAFKLSEKMRQGLIETKSWIEEMGYQQKTEIKHGSLAIHWRGLSNEEISSIKNNVVSGLFTIASRSSLELRDFDGGIELRAPGKNKGEAVKKILSRLPNAVVSYLGDDLTDEDAFQALGSAGLKILVNTNKRQTLADLWIKPPDELFDFLHTWRTSL